MSLWDENPKYFHGMCPNEVFWYNFCYLFFVVVVFLKFDTIHCYFWFGLRVSLMTKQLNGKCCLHLPPWGPKMYKDMGLWQHQKSIMKSFFLHLTRAMVKFHFSNPTSSRDLWNAIKFVNILWTSLYNWPTLFMIIYQATKV